MDHPNKRQKVGDSTSSYKEEVLFNSDTLSKIISYLPSVDVFNLAITCKRFGVSNNDELSVIKKSTRILVQDIATEEEQLAALPHYKGESSLADYHYLQLVREPLSFDQLVDTEYVNTNDKSCVTQSCRCLPYVLATAFSNNILRAGKHYVTFIGENYPTPSPIVGVMRPGEADQGASGLPLYCDFYQNFSQRFGKYNNSNVNCCLYNAHNGLSCGSDWEGSRPDIIANWDGMESMSTGDELGMLLDLDEGTLTVYKNGRKLGVMKRGLKGPYCWVVSMLKGIQITIKRGTIPSS